MRLLLDTHILIWSISESSRFSRLAKGLIGDPENQPLFSVVSLWEVAIKNAIGRVDSKRDVRWMRGLMLERGYEEITVVGAHAEAIDLLPPIHKDPFDRMLVAQAAAEGVLLLTADPVVARYAGPVRLV